jgi:hypothetical protein
MRARLCRRLARLPPPDTPPDPQLVAIALETARDGKHRAADVEWDSPTNLEGARLALRNQLNDTAIPVQPWIWKQSTSGGTALTNAGCRLGVELRFSRKRKA